ncbi:THUMP domain-containing protein 1 homolog [Anopheles bellator]|uniref:THUMP domain-containing protein 1 homolog n=1 Tax=Anopheles bellator TaxID=139047 RepID=UPI00264A37DD|nr:THUMP domain-containing protein 1 homolog [Anopheles bellator]
MSDSKRIKLNTPGKGNGHNRQKKGNFAKRNFYARNDRFMQPGQRGFLVTCNGRVHDCTRDSYRILNEYADLLYGPAAAPAEPTDAANEKTGEESEEDISVTLQKETEAAGKTKTKEMRFQQVDSGATNCLFIRTTLKEPTELALRVLKDLSDSKKPKSRFILRMVPIEAVCRANLRDLIDTVGGLCDRHFLKEPKTYAIIFNHRLNNELSRDDVIRELAQLITSKNVGNKANLSNPDLAVIVEVIKGLCCIGILPEYYQLRKYNLAEVVTQPQALPKPSSSAAAENTEPTTGTTSSETVQ